MEKTPENSKREVAPRPSVCMMQMWIGEQAPDKELDRKAVSDRSVRTGRIEDRATCSSCAGHTGDYTKMPLQQAHSTTYK